MSDVPRKCLPTADNECDDDGNDHDVAMPNRNPHDDGDNNTSSSTTPEDDDTVMAMASRPQHETLLLPRKRSEATKSPPPIPLRGSTAAFAAVNAMGEDVATPSISSAIAASASATEDGGPTITEPATTRRNLRSTPHEMKNTKTISQLLRDNCEGKNELANISSTLTGARTSLNASFDAAAASATVTAGATTTPLSRSNSSQQLTMITSSSSATSSGSKANPKYTSPKRRRQSLDKQYPAQKHHSSTGQAFTPLRPPRTQQKRYRKKESEGRSSSSSNVLFSPKPVYSAEKKGGRSKRPPRPSPSGSGSASDHNANAAAMGHSTSAGGGSNVGVGGANSGFRGVVAVAPPSSPLTPSPTKANLVRKSSGGSVDSGSPANGGAPFRFHSFPASLPRVNARGVGSGSGGSSGSDGFSGSSGGDAAAAASASAGPAGRGGFRMNSPNGPNAGSSPPRALPASPASRRLFARSGAGDSTGSAKSSSSATTGAVEPKRLSLGDARSSAAVDDEDGTDRVLARVNSHDRSAYGDHAADVSGDWSESTSIRSLTNERIRMSKVPSHVMSHGNPQFSQHYGGGSTLNDLEEEIGDDADTIVMEEDSDDDGDSTHVEKSRDNDKPIEGDIDILQKESSESALLGTKLNFNSPPPLPNETPTTAGGGIGGGIGGIGGIGVGASGRKHPPGSLESTLHPHTPRGLSVGGSTRGEGQSFHIHNLEVSPIVRLPEDEDDEFPDHEMADQEIPMKGPLDDEEAEPMTKLPPGKGGSSSSSSGRVSSSLPIHPPLFHHEAPSPILRNRSTDTTTEGMLSNLHHSTANLESSSEAGVMNTSAHSSGTVYSGVANTTASTANANNATLNSTLSKPTAIRKLRRPMPDTSAFDLGTPSQQSLGSKDSGFHSHKTAGGGGAMGTSVMSSSGDNHNNSNNNNSNHSRQLLCPPTPIRTPAWAHAAENSLYTVNSMGPLKRANSLITTKVLAACAPRVLDNLSSLEDSMMMENDISGSTMDSTAEPTNNSMEGSTSLQYHSSSFAPVMEEGKDAGYDSLTEDAADERTREMGGGGDARMFRSLEEEEAEEEGPAERITSTTLPNPRETTVSFQRDGDDRGESSTNSLSWNTPKPASAETTETSSDALVTFSDFDNLGILGSGAFADVYKVRSKKGDRRLYAIKRTRRQFRGVKDRERAMAEVHTMKRLQNALLREAAAASSSSSSAAAGASSQPKGHAGEGGGGHPSSKSNYGLYLLFFIRAWQQDGFFYCQTEFCSRATCRHLRLSLSSEWERDVVRYPSLRLCLEGAIATDDGGAPPVGRESEGAATIHNQNRLIPERAIWQICHDISRGLYHIHSYNMVHYDIKPSNIFFVFNAKWGGTICKIGDFGLAGDVGTKDDGQEGDTVYMPNELLGSSVAKHPGADIFSLGLALYELAAGPNWSLPREGDRWHEIRSGTHRPELPRSRSESLVKLIRDMIRPDVGGRPSAENISEMMEVKRANALSDSFLSQYINDVEKYDSRREREMESAEEEARRRSSTPIASMFNHYALGSDTSKRTITRHDMRTPTNNGDDPTAFFRR